MITLTVGLGTELHIEERPYTEEIQSEGQTTIVSGTERELVWERGWAPSWLYSLSLGLAVPFSASWLLLAGVFAVLVGGAWAGKHLSRWRSSPILFQAIGAGWVLLIPIIVLLQLGVSTSHWESAFLDLLVFAVGGFFSFFIGLVLALARTSPYMAIRVSAVGYIEVVRAAPLLVWLLFATFLDDEFGPIGEAFSNIDLVYRVMIVFAFFGGAYIAEVLRGGLQSIPRGQHEASEAIGLSAAQKYIFIILPQAIKSVIPAIIAHQHTGKGEGDPRGPNGHSGGCFLRDIHCGRAHILADFVSAIPAWRSGGNPIRTGHQITDQAIERTGTWPSRVAKRYST
jgi:His/Glu/Gln/Arg/opine family amino acid ABC transporter permease subunit